MAILETLMMSIDLTDEEREHVRSLHSGHESQLRLSHYPAIPGDMLGDEDMVRLATHTDWRF